MAVDPPGVESNREMLDAKGNQRAVDGTTSQVYIYIYMYIYYVYTKWRFLLRLTAVLPYVHGGLQLLFFWH